MRLDFNEGWAGRRRKTAICPNCSSDRARYSRRHYGGPWFLLFRVRPVKCSDCGCYFAVAPDATIRRPEADLVGLHVPLRPSELDDFAEAAAEEPAAPQSNHSLRPCPVCGSHDVHLSNPGGDQSIARRLDVRTAYRCAHCNGRFRRVSPPRLFLSLGMLLVALGGLSYLATAFLGGRRAGNAAPTIRKDQIKPPPPPVFR